MDRTSLASYRMSRRTLLKLLGGTLAFLVVPTAGCIDVEIQRGDGTSAGSTSASGTSANGNLVSSRKSVTRAGQWHQTTVADFQAGTQDKTSVVKIGDGALALAAGATQGTYTSSVRKTEFSFNMVAAALNSQLPHGAAIALDVRTSQNGTDWSDWTHVHGPSPAATRPNADKDDNDARTTAVSVGSYLQYRVSFSSSGASSGEAPVLEDITVTYIDSSQGPTIGEAKSVPLPKAAGQPTIISREGWGADEKLRFDANGKDVWPAEYSQPLKLVVHHTLTPNDETDAPAIVRAIYYYHTVTLGWGDIGYHFLIDASGNIYEGRRGDGIIGGHAYGHNVGSIGIAILGDYRATDVPGPAQTALASMLTWLCNKYAIDPVGHSFFVDRDLFNIYGHRDSNPTDCPGDRLYALLPGFRKAVVIDPGPTTWYFAEGATVPAFQTWLLLLNPNPSAAPATITFYDEAGQTSHTDVQIGARSRLNVFVNSLVKNKAIGMKVESEQIIYAERAMYFGHDGHCSPGASDPSKRWYFAEGSTAAPFDTWLLLLNPGSTNARCQVSYYKPDGSVVNKTYDVAPTSRRTISVNGEVPNTAISMKVEADQPVVAERSMYFDHGAGGHNTVGVNYPSETWYFAEGDGGSSFDTWILLFNPNADPTKATLTFLGENGQTETASYTIPATTRMNVWIDKLVPPGGVATIVKADDPIVAERSMYWDNARAGTDTVGATAPATQWYFAEGSTTSFNEWLLIMNPNGDPAKVTVTLLDEHGQATVRTFSLAGSSRLNIWVNQIVSSSAISAIVQSDVPIVAERSMYTLDNLGGTNSLGIPR